MYKILNKFLGSKYFDILPRFLSRKIFKIFKIFFVETNLKNLPNENHPTKIDKKNQTEIIKNNNNPLYRPFSTCSYLLELLTLYQSINTNKIKFLDFGANNLDNYIYLNRYLKNWEYIYHDLSTYNEFVIEFIKEKKLNNISVLENINLIEKELDFIFFGSSIHYLNDYKEIIKKISKTQSKYIIFSHTPFYKSNNNDKDIVMKQVNIHPTINYAFLIQYENFIKYMRENNYELISQNKNNFIKFLNFKNFRDFSFISFLDLFFKRIN
jgi:putative methyltransferase (TIGR04325 family)